MNKKEGFALFKIDGLWQGISCSFFNLDFYLDINPMREIPAKEEILGILDGWR